MKTITTLYVFLFVSSIAQAASGITYHGRIISSSNNAPFESPTAEFRIRIKSPGSESCLMWQETQTRDMTASDGVFTLTVGQATAPNTTAILNSATAANFTLPQVFSNGVNYTGLTCSIGTSYNALSLDGRVLEMSFRATTGVGAWEDLPATTVNYVPLAYRAVDSETLGGRSANEFLKIASYPSQVILSNPQVDSLLGLVNGSSTTYLRPADAFAGDVTGPSTATVVARIRGTNVVATAPTLNQVLKFDGTNWVPSADDAGAAPGDASYAAKGVVQINTDQTTSGLFIASGVLALPNVITAAGPIGGVSTIPVVTYDQKGRLTAVTTATVDDTTKLPLAGGTMTGPINMGTQNITNATSVAATNFSGRNLILNDNDTNTVTVRTPADITANYILQLPSDDGTAGQVLLTDGAGVLSWGAPSGGTVTSVSSTNSYLSVATATTTPALTLNVGTAANTVAAGDDSRIVNAVQAAAYAADLAPAALCTTAQTPYWNTVSDLWACQNISVANFSGNLAGDVTGPQGTTVVERIRGTNVVATAPTLNQVLKFDGTNWVPSADAGLTAETDPGVQAWAKAAPNAIFSTAGDVLNITSRIPSALATPAGGQNGQTLRWNNGTSQWEWFTPGVAGAGITTLNGLTDVTQTFEVGTNGTDFDIVSVGTEHTFHIPTASASTNRGVLTSADWTTFNNKLTSPLTTKGDLIVHDGAAHVRLPVGTNGQILSANSGTASGLEWIASPIGDITEVVAGAGLTGGATSGSATLTIGAGTGIVVNADDVAVNVGTGANQIVQLNGTSQLPAVSGVNLTNLNADNIASGTLAIARGGTGAITANAALNNLLPSQATFAGRMLATDGTNTSWVAPTTGTVTEVTSANAYLSVATGTTTPALTLNVGTAANTVAAGDDSRITGAVQQTAYNADLAPAALCTTAQTPYWNTVSDLWACQNISVSADTLGLFANGGNTFAGAATLGTNDNFGLNFETNNSTRMTIANTGEVELYRNNPSSTSYEVFEVDMLYSGGATLSGAATGVRSSVRSDNTGTRNTLRGLSSDVQNWSSGTIQRLAGSYNYVHTESTSGTVTNSIGSESVILSNGGSMTNAIGFLASITQPSGTITNAYGLYVDPLAGTNRWGIYQAGASDNNYFAGNVGIGATAPGAMLQLGTAGTSLGTMRLTGNTSGYVQIQPAAAAGSWTMTLPANDGDSGQVLTTDGSGVTSWAASGGATTLNGLTDVVTDYATTYNMYLGSGVGTTTTTGNRNTGIGAQSMQALTTGVENTAIGNQAMQSVTSGGTNTAIGRESLLSLTTGHGNTGIGSGSLTNVIDGSGNTALGSAALYYLLSTSGNTAIGRTALHRSEGWNNTALGEDAGANQQNGDNNIYIGHSAGPTTFPTNESDRLYIHNASGNPTIFGDLANLRIGLGGMTDPSTTLDINGAITQRGMAAPALSSAGQGRIYFDSTSNTFRASQNGGAYVDLINSGSVTGTGTTNFIPKWSSATGLTDSIIREVASQVSIGGAAVGTHTFSVVGGNANINGVSVGRTSAGSANTLLGDGALSSNTSDGNTAIGRHALASNLAGQYNTAVGYNSLESNLGNYNVAIGADTMAAGGSGSANTALGQFALTSVSSGGNNVGLGQNAGANITTGSDNIIIGQGASAASATGNFQLNIGDLIFGDMTAASRMVDVNGSMNVRGLASAPSLSALDNGKFYYDNTDDRLKVSLNGGAYVNLLTSMSGFNANQAVVANGSGVASSFTCSVGQVLGFDASGFAVCSNVPLSGGTFLAGDGTAAAPSFSFSSDTNTGIFRAYGDAIGFSFNGTQNFTMDSNALYGGDLYLSPWNGTNTLPNYTFSGDTNTGMYSPSADTISFSTGGTDRVTIDSAGYVGIGVTPTARLHTSQAITAISGETSMVRNYVTFTPSAPTTTSNGGTGIQNDVWFNGANTFSNWGNHGSKTVAYSNLTTPATMGDHMNGLSGQAVQANSGEVARMSGVHAYAYKAGAGNVVRMFGLRAETSTINASGNVTYSYGVHSTVGNSGTTSNAYGVFVDTVAGTNKWSFYANDATAPSYFAGNVGIGATAPGAMLQIGTAGTSLGTMRLTGNTSGYVQIQPAAAAGSWTMTLPTTDGNSGEVLTTNGSGVTSWAAAGGATTLDGLTDVVTGYGSTNNMYLGSGVGTTTTSGASNTGIGTLSLPNITSASNTVAVGSESLFSLTTGSSNVAVGRESMYSTTTGGNNTAVGMYVLAANTTGSSNTAIGDAALSGADAGDNTAVGAGALGGALTGGANAALGNRAGIKATGASTSNIFLGNMAGPDTNTTVTESLWIHNWEGLPTIYGDLLNRRVGIGTTTLSDKFHVLGDIRVGTTGTNGCLKGFGGATITGTCSSDIRLKKDFRPMTSVSDKLSQIQPMYYKWRSEEFPDRHYGNEDQLGVMAQEVKRIFPSLVVEDEDGYYQVKYADFTMYLLKGFSEHHQQIQSQKMRSEMSEKQMQSIQRSVASIKEDLDSYKSESQMKIKKLESENAALKARLDKIEKTLLNSTNRN